jgi:hypothetical protein
MFGELIPHGQEPQMVVNDRSTPHKTKNNVIDPVLTCPINYSNCNTSTSDVAVGHK